MLIYLQRMDSPTERSKFEQIYSHHKNRMYRVAFSILHNEQDAEDAVHQAFVTIAENIQKISEPMCPKTTSYIVTIVESKAIDLYRRKKRHPVIPLEEISGFAVTIPEGGQLANCMAKLPARYRQVLLLKHYHGYTTKEIAAMLSLSVSNISKLEQRAKAKLEQLCKEANIL